MIRVMIDRHIAESLESHYWETIKRLLKEAVSAPGYLSGETLVDVSDPNHCIVWSTWRTEADWLNWYKSEQRKNITQQLAPMLDREERYTVFSHPQ